MKQKGDDIMKKILCALTCTIMVLFLNVYAFSATWTITGTLVLMGNGGTFSNGNIRYSQSYTGTATTGGINNIRATIPSVTPTRTGYRFTGWKGAYTSDLTNNGTSIILGSDYNYSSGGSLYLSSGQTKYLLAAWEAIYYNITYNYNDGVTSQKTVQKSYGSTLKLYSEVPERDGYDFIGWDTDASSDTVVYAPGASYSSNANLTLYAVWQPHTYTINYYDNGGTGSPDSQTKTHNVSLAIPDLTPSRPGYAFLGWSEDKKAVSADFYPGDLTEDRNMELYAVWRIVLLSNSVTVSGDSQGTGGDNISQDIYFSVKDTINFFSITIEYPSFLSYSDFETYEFDENIYVAERTENTNHILEISYYSENGFSAEDTSHLARIYFDVNDSDTHNFGNYSISVNESSSYFMNTSGNVINLNYGGKQAFEYLTHIAQSIEISGLSSISEPTVYTVIFTPLNTTNQGIEWSVDDENVALIDETGLLTPLKNGTVNITAKTLDGSNLITSKAVEITGQKTMISDFVIPNAIWQESFSPDTYEYIVYIPVSTDSVSFTPVFDSGSLLCEGYGYFPSGIKRTFSISSDMQSFVFTKSENGYTDTKYTISVIKRDVKGDVNSDGVIDEIDSSLILKHISGINTLTSAQTEKADVNNDGNVDLTDAVAILKNTSF